MFKNVHIVYYNSSEDRCSEFELHSTHTEFNESLIQQIDSNIKGPEPVVVVNAKAYLPHFWQSRLLQAMVENDAINHISALNVSNYQLSPITSKFKGNLEQLDQAVFLLQQAHYFPCSIFNDVCFAVRNTGHLSAENGYFAINNLVVDTPAQNPQLIKAPKAPDVGDQRPLPVHPLTALQIKCKALNHKNIKPGFPGLDNKPVVLHTTMDWGGGVHHWINEFIINHSDMHHLVLISQGEFFRQQQGEQFELRWLNTNGMMLDTFHLSKPIKSTVVHNPQYQALLNSIINQWQVSSVVVSSLIGHAMDCLKTGLPTLRILHDYFPHWPSLNAQLDADVIEQGKIEQALTATKDEPFGRITATQLTQWQQANNQLLAEDNIKIIAPDESVKINLLKLPHTSSFNKTVIIPHAIEPIEAINYQAANKPFKVLVLGRITPPKGQKLLQTCIEKLENNKGIEFVLLGAGDNGKGLKKFTNTQVISDYQHRDLSQLLNEAAPQLGLITAQTAETFSYTLSEMLMAGIPVLCHPVGALKNRVIDNINGVFVSADADAVCEKIMRLADQPEQLNKLHHGALSTKLTSVAKNTAAYSQLLISDSSTIKPYQTEGLLSIEQWHQQLHGSHFLAQQFKRRFRHSEKELLEQSLWAKKLNQHNEHLAKNIELGRDEIKHLNAAIKEQSHVYENELSKLNKQCLELNQHLDTINQELQATSDLRDQLTANNESLSQALHDRETTLENMRNSRSWRVTKPLRSFTTYARHKTNAIKFRYTQVKGLPKRVVNSLKSRGVKQTALIAKNKLSKPQPQTKTLAQAVSEDYQTINIATSSQPLVTVVIPVYNEFKHTYHCLKSISKLADKTTFEVVLIDDCSTDETVEAIKNISGITYHRQEKNGGFIESCNTGAELAKGQYLLFLNNDTEVLAGWLDELVLTFEQQTNAGLVGSQLLYPDGRLQEAGGIVFSDASGWNYGRLQQPDEPEYQHLRETAYVSGASIMISKSLFEQLGSFDQRYKPAYYEDTDLAFAVRKAGLKVYYQPLSRVIHFEGISSGTDTSSGTKKYQVINQQKFLEKWQHELASQPEPGSDIEMARFQNQSPRVLIFDACTPTPDQDSGSLRMMNLMKIFKQLGYQISFVPENMAHFENYTHDLQRLGVECVYAPKYSTPLAYLKDKGERFELILLSRYYVAEPLMPMIRSYCPAAKIWFDTVDLHYLREHRMAELEQDNHAIQAANKTKIKELSVADNCDLTLVVSPYEQEVLAKEKPKLDVAVLSNIHQIYGGHQGYVKSQDIMFIGGYQHTPNVDGVLWFVEQILPLIIDQIADLKFHIVGSKAPEQVKALGKHPNIEFHGFVDNIAPLMQSTRIAVAPLRFGAGVKGKVNMSMSYGQPVVGTKVAVEGMYTKQGVDVMMADQATDFAAAVIELYQKQALWEQISKGGLANVEKWFSFTAAQNTIAQLLEPQ